MLLVSVLGITISVFRRNIFLIWIGLELKMFGFIPLVYLKTSRALNKRQYSDEINVSFYYFLVQVLGRILFSWACLLGESWLGLLGLRIKIGLFPFFFWVPVVINRLDWIRIGLIRTLQKIVPLLLLRLVFDIERKLAAFLFLIGAIVRVIGINYSSRNLKLVVGWSSVGNIRIIFYLLKDWSKLGLIYFLLYGSSVMLIRILMSLEKKKNVKNLVVCYFLILIFSGLPPFLGFLRKIYLFTGLNTSDSAELFFINLFYNKMMVMFPIGIISVNWNWFIGLLFSFVIVGQIIGYIKIFIKVFSRSLILKSNKLVLNKVLYFSFIIISLMSIFFFS